MDQKVTIEVPNFLAQLLGEIEHCDPMVYSPKFPRKDDEKVIPWPDGECPIFVKKLYALAQFYRREHGVISVECRFTPCEEHQDIHAKMAEYFAKFNLLENLYWAIMCDLCRVWGIPYYGMRKEWTFVETKAPKGGPGGIIQRLITGGDPEDGE